MARRLALLWFAGACTRVNPAFGLDDTAGGASASGSGSSSSALEGGPSTSLESTVGGASESGQDDASSASSGDSNATTAPLETSSETEISGCVSPDSSELGVEITVSGQSIDPVCGASDTLVGTIVSFEMGSPSIIGMLPCDNCDCEPIPESTIEISGVPLPFAMVELVGQCGTVVVERGPNCEAQGFVLVTGVDPGGGTLRLAIAADVDHAPYNMPEGSGLAIPRLLEVPCDPSAVCGEAGEYSLNFGGTELLAGEAMHIASPLGGAQMEVEVLAASVDSSLCEPDILWRASR